MPAKRKFNVKDFLALLKIKSFSTGEISRKLKCNRGTALKYLKELKVNKQVIETRISNTINQWKLTFFGNPIMIGDCAQTLKQLPEESIDLIVTDPPYGYNLMGLDWDLALPSIDSLKECCRVLKAGAFAFIMWTPRQDLLSRMICRLQDAGFETGFSSISWVYHTGFPKISDVSKNIDKRAGVEREVVGKAEQLGGFTCQAIRNIATGYENADKVQARVDNIKNNGGFNITAPSTIAAKQFDGSYTPNSLKPAVERVLVCMKSKSEKTYTDQALKNGKSILWLDDCRIPYASESEKWQGGENPNENGRFPANLLVSDDALNNGIINHGNNKPTARTAGANALGQGAGCNAHQNKPNVHVTVNDADSASRFFDLDAWFRSKLPQEAQKTYPALIVPKPSKNEKNRHGVNEHPTVKPLKLMSYLITMGSREGDLVLDPFAGSGTTLEAANMLNRRFIGCELDEKYKDLIEARAFMRTTVKSG